MRGLINLLIVHDDHTCQSNIGEAADQSINSYALPVASAPALESPAKID